jgi:hypothetical protein
VTGLDRSRTKYFIHFKPNASSAVIKDGYDCVINIRCSSHLIVDVLVYILGPEAGHAYRIVPWFPLVEIGLEYSLAVCDS